jgi:hypothetical protein
MDADVISYNARIIAGGNQSLSMQSLRQLNQFVISIKKMNLWASMICWPLRANQNAGSANTVYSLGGLQRSNATKTGGSWGPDGIFFSGSTEYMLSDLGNIPKDITLFVVAKGNGSSYGSFPWIGGVYSPISYSTSCLAFGNAALGTNVPFIVAQPSGFLLTSEVANGLSGASSFVALSGSYKRNAVFNVRNVSASTVATQGSYLVDEATTLTKMILNGRWEGASVSQGNPITPSFYAIITPNCDSVISSFYSLYKTTLGQDLGLP